MSDCFYPAGAGLISYLFGSAYEPFGANRWADRADAASYAEDMQPYFPNTDCHVVSEYYSEAPDYQWRVVCDGKPA